MPPFQKYLLLSQVHDALPGEAAALPRERAYQDSIKPLKSLTRLSVPIGVIRTNDGSRLSETPTITARGEKCDS
jgi:hypothetical protein